MLLGFFTTGALLSAPAGEARTVDAVVVPGVEIVDSMDERGSWGEALAVRARMQAEGLRSVMVVGDPPWRPGWRWWRNPEASGFVGNEVLKLGYYVVRYRFGF